MTTLLSGSVVDDKKYRIIAKLGEGGAASVYKAEEIALSRRVALKVLHRYRVDGKEDYQRFQQEASILAGLSHKNIVAVYRFGLLNEQEPFMVFEFVEGEALATRLVRGPLTEQKTIEIGIQISQALSYAHQRNVVHRDLKPLNVMLQQMPEPDAVKILDFGLSRILNIQYQSADKLTLTGELIGTPEYMSPEQSRGDVVDARTDIYSIGCILYECIAGQAPLQADNPIAMLYKQRYEWPESLASISDKKNVARPSSAFEQIVFKCLQKDIDKRFQTASELEGALRLLKSGLTQELTFTNIQIGKNIEVQRSFVPKALLLSLLVGVGLTVSCFVISSYLSPKTKPVDKEKVIYTPPKAQTDNSAELDNLIDKGDLNDAESLKEKALEYRGNNDYASAEPLFLRELKLREEQGDATVNLAMLTEIYEKKKKYKEAEQMLTHWLPIKQKVLDPSNPEIAHCLQLLARVYWDQHNYAKAEENYELAVLAAQKSEAPLLQARILHAMAHMYVEEKKLAKAEDTEKRSLRILEKNYGANLDIGNSLDLLVALCRMQGKEKLPEGLKLAKRSLSCRENALADLGMLDRHLHEPTVNSLSDEVAAGVKTQRDKLLLIRDLANANLFLGMVYLDMGKYDEAEPLFKRSMEISERFLKSVGLDIFNEANVADSYAVLLRMTNRSAEADKMVAQAAAIRSGRR